MVDHKSASLKAICSGFALNVINDLQIKNKFNFLQNVRIKKEGEIRSRDQIGLVHRLDYTPDPVPPFQEVPHSMKTIVNKDGDLVNRIVGAGESLFTGSNTALKKDDGYSGLPLSIVDFRPEEAIEAHAYIGDRNKFKKVSVSDVLSDVGITAPTKALRFNIVKPTRKIIDNITTADIGDWNHLTGSAGVPAAVTIVNTTILEILYDGVAPNFASVIPLVFDDNTKVGRIITFDSADDLIVEEVNPSAIKTGVATITSIVYDTAPVNTGLCTIVLSTPNLEIKRNSILKLDGTEYVRVLEVTRDANNIPSVRCSTVGTFTATNVVAGIDAFRVYATNTYVATDTLFAEALSSAIGASGVSSITKTIAIDLTNADGKPLSLEDFLHLSFQSSLQAQIEEVQILLDCNNGTANFTDNFFQYVIAQNFFTNSITQTSSTLSTVQQTTQRSELLSKLQQLYTDGNFFPDVPLFGGDVGNEAIDAASVPVTQASTGDNQWTELFIPLKALNKVGADTSRTLKDIQAIRISIKAFGAVTILIDSIYCGGGNALNTEGNTNSRPYNYIWRVRDPATKASSNWSPPLREGIRITRGQTELLPVDAFSDFSTDYVIDIARYGGNLNDYRIIGTIPNDGTTFIDNVSDLTAANNTPASRRLSGDQIGDEEVFDFYKPFVFLDTPKNGTCDVVGTKLTVVSGDDLNVTYPRGTALLINGTLNRFYTNPTDTTHVELEKDMGSLVGVNFEIKAPLLTAQPLAHIAGTFGDGNSGLFIFGWGNDLAAGTLYWLDGNSPDTMSDINFLEITSPSEPIVAGGIYDGYLFLFTTRRSFYLVPTFQSGQLGFIARENANSRGCFSPYSFCVGRDYIYFLTENGDGICRVPGSGNPQSLTDGSLYNLFIHEGVEPDAVVLSDSHVIYAPDFTLPEKIRLFYCRDTVVFKYTDTQNHDVAVIFDERINDWISYDTYLNNNVGVFYQEEIESESNLLVGIAADAEDVGFVGAVGKFDSDAIREASLETKVLPFSMDDDDVNMLKQFNEIVFDLDAGLDTKSGFDFRVVYNDGNLVEPPYTDTTPYNIPGTDDLVSLPILREKYPFKIGTEISNLARNITTTLIWKLDTLVKFYGLIYYYLPRADLIIDRPSEDNFAESLHDKYWQGVVIEADTFGEDKILQWRDDDNVVRASILINHTGKITRSYAFPVPFISHRITRFSDDEVNWIFYKEQYEFNLEPELGHVWKPQKTTHGIAGLKTIKRIGITYRSTDDTTLVIRCDGSELITQPLLSSSGVKVKSYFYLPANKFVFVEYEVTSDIPSSPIAKKVRIYQKDFEVWIRGFNSQDDFQPIQPFGDIDYDQGARI